MIRAAVILILALLLAPAFLPALAHDHWIMKGGHRNAAGEWCCGEGDCIEQFAVQTVTLPAPGFRLASGEFVPQSEAMVSQDGKFWRCKRPDGSRRCFFYPPASM